MTYALVKKINRVIMDSFKDLDQVEDLMNLLKAVFLINDFVGNGGHACFTKS